MLMIMDKEFDSGAVKITPAHDPNDFEVGLRHKLPQITVMNESGAMNEEAGKYQGLDRSDCRKQIVADLSNRNKVYWLTLRIICIKLDIVSVTGAGKLSHICPHNGS